MSKSKISLLKELDQRLQQEKALVAFGQSSAYENYVKPILVLEKAKALEELEKDNPVAEALLAAAAKYKICKRLLGVFEGQGLAIETLEERVEKLRAEVK